MTCPICNNTGMYGYHKPVGGIVCGVTMVFVPQVCSCPAGDKWRGMQCTVSNDTLSKWNEAMEKVQIGISDVH